MIAIVGTGEPSENAKETAFRFSKELSNNGTLIISGGALGMDTAAHKGVLESAAKETVSVLGSGFFRPYPPENENLFDEIINNGGLLVSENVPNFRGADYSFVFRNRIISGLADSVFLVATNEWRRRHGSGREGICTKKTIIHTET